MIVDAHTHFFSHSFFAALAGQSMQPGSVEERLARVAARAGIELPPEDDRKHIARWLAALDAVGVDHAVTFASLPAEADAVADAVAHGRGRFSAYGLVDPSAADAADFTRRLFERLGFRGILLFPAMHHVHPASTACRAVLDVVAEHHGVALVHCGILQVRLRDLLGLPRPYDLSFANPLGVVPAANAYPEVHFVIPHFGGGFFRECLMVGAQCENVYADSSSSNAWMATQADTTDLETVFQRALGVFGPERLLFGTDSSTFPRGYRGDLLDAQQAALHAVGASEKERAAILGGNAARILGLRP